MSGLSSTPKFLSSKYFYDDIGDELFVQIMKMPEYYLTRAEHEIFIAQSKLLIGALEVKKGIYFELIELGAGDGTKTKELLKELLQQEFTFDYIPVDISQHALDGLENALKRDFPDLNVKTKQGEYFGILETLKHSAHPKIVLFLGSNIGNLLDANAHRFIYQLGANLNFNDKVVLGIDLIKSEAIVLPAYNDSQGITAKFNLNLLERINRELDADFDCDSFDHQPEYTEKEGIARSFLTSKIKQTVKIKSLDKTFQFEAGEKIHTEISRKYNDEILENILSETDFGIVNKFSDSKNYFADYILNRRMSSMTISKATEPKFHGYILK